MESLRSRVSFSREENGRDLGDDYGKITGIGGGFFKAKTDNKALREWYKQHLGLQLEEWGGGALRWPEDKAEDKGVTAWQVAEPATK